MIALRDIPFGEKFYWKGKKWVKVIEPKHPKGKAYKLVCAQHPQGPWVDMPSGRKVKPIIRIKNETKRNH